MASLTLVEAAKVQQNKLIRGIIETVVTVNPFYQFFPFDQIVGNALLYTRENALGGVAPIGIGGGSNTVPAGAKTPATFTPVTTPLKAMIGDAMVDHFINTTMSTDNNQTALQVGSKAKALGREYQRQFILGDSGVDPLEFDGLSKLTPAAQVIEGASAVLTFEMLDAVISLVKAKDGQVDFLMMNDETIRKYRAMMRAAGGNDAGDFREIGGRRVLYYGEVPILRNDWIASSGTTTRIADIYAGCFDDGSRKTGIAGLTSSVQSGIFISAVGEAELTNDIITRLRFYASLAVFNELGIAKLNDVKIN
jgi:hypothetical protein